MSSKEVDWVFFDNETRVYVGVQDVAKIIYHDGFTHYVDIIFNNGEVHRCFGIREIKFKEKTAPADKDNTNN